MDRPAGVWANRGRGRGRGAAAGGGSNVRGGKAPGQEEFRPTGPIRIAVRSSTAASELDNTTGTPVFRILQPSRPASDEPEDPTPAQSVQMSPRIMARPNTAGNPAPPVVSAPSPVHTALPVNGNATLTKSIVRPRAPVKPAGTVNQRLAPFIPKSTMDLSVRLVDDKDEFQDITDYLTESTAFTVIGIIGPQGSGKSTLLSMIAGNEPMDMYREYIFRPCSREAVESCLHQTSKINVYVGNDQTIYLDCQPMMSPALLDDIIKQQRRSYGTHDTGPEIQHEQESHRMLSFLYQVCHTLILCTDWFIDMNLIRELRNAESMCTTPTHSERNSESIKPKANRKVNLVLVQQRCKVEDYEGFIIRQRSAILSKIFNGSRLRVDGEVTMQRVLGHPEDLVEDIKTNYLLFPELKPRQREGYQHFVNRRPQFGECNLEKTVKFGMVEYADVLRGLKKHIKGLPRDPFTTNEPKITEKQWYQLASRTWKKLNERTTPSSRNRHFSTFGVGAAFD